MKRSEVTYEQLDKALRSLGFSCRVLKKEPPVRVYEHKESGALISITLFPPTNFAMAYQLAAARLTVDQCGIADPEDFNAILYRGASRNHARSATGGTQAGDGLASLRKAEVTYGQLDKVLRSLGFTCRVVKRDPPARVYDHKESGASMMMPPFPEDDRVLAHHLAGARVMVDEFGIAEPKVFDAKLRKAAARSPAPPRDKA
jgi:hypothetical protein